MKKNIFLPTAIAVTLFSAPAMAGFINFEDAPSRGITDNDEIANAYYADLGITFKGAYLEATGSDDADPQAFKSSLSGVDVPLVPGLGDYFMRTSGDFGTDLVNFEAVSIHYDDPTRASGFDIWDIDGDGRVNQLGTEEWRVDAYLDDVFVKSVSSPVGDTTGGDSLNGKPYRAMISGVMFDRLDIVFTGTKEKGIGLAFDRFSTTTVPEPGTLALLGLGLFGLTAARRRMSV